MFPQFPQTSHFPAYFHSIARREHEKRGGGGGGPQGGVGRGARVEVEEEVGCIWGGEREVGGGWGLHPASELIGTALLFYPPTEHVVFGRHTSYQPASSLSRPLPLQQRGATPTRSALNTYTHTHTHTHTPASLTYPQVSSLLSWVSVVKLRLDCPRLGQLYWVSFFFFFSFSHWFSLISVFFGMVFPFPPPHPHAMLKNRVDGLKNFTLYRTTRTNTERRLNWEERDRKVS